MDLTDRYKRFGATGTNTGHTGTSGESGKSGVVSPECLMITCMDLTCSLYPLFGFQDGQALIMRSAGPLLPAYDPDCAASQLFEENLKLAIHDMGITNIAIIGHTGCKTADKLSRNLYGSGDIPRLRSQASQIMQMALNACGSQNQACVAHEIEKQILINGIKTLFDYPVILAGIRDSRLIVEGLQIDTHNNAVYKLNTDGKGFYLDELPAADVIAASDCGCPSADTKFSTTNHA